MNYTDKFCKALAYAATAHTEQRRKGSNVPYISHLLGVTAIVLDAGGDETEAIAAVLHDVVEDQPLPQGGGQGRLDDVEVKFGKPVAIIVKALSDWISADIDEKKADLNYIDRKIAYHGHLRSETLKSVLLVSAADKLHNARAMESDFDKIGDKLWSRFNGTRELILWNYEELVAIYKTSPVSDSRRTPIVDLLAATVDRLGTKSGNEPLAPSRSVVTG